MLFVSAILLLPYAAAFAWSPNALLNALKNAVDCDSCHALLVPLKGLAELGDSAFVKVLIVTCQVLKLEDNDVCVGAISEQGPILAHALREISPFGSTATKLCEGIFGLCQSPAVNQYTVPLPEGPLSMRVPAISTGKPPFQVVHFSDVHIDREYVSGSNANCEKPICCRNFADEAGSPSEPAGPFGNRNCDSPAGLAKSMLEAISAHHTFSIFTGDVVEAAVWLVNKNEVTNDIGMFNQELVNTLNGPVFPAIGNQWAIYIGASRTLIIISSDAAPVNSFPRDPMVGLDVQWVFDLEGKQWANWINMTAANEVTHFSGSYSVTAPGTNLRILSINTVYWYKQNFWLYDSDTPEPDPHGILAFMVNELIIGHMPPGSQDAFSDQSNYYDQIVQRYNNTIAGQFFGHTHYDEIEIAYSNYGDRTAETAVGVTWIAPALTPRSGNPAFKTYDVDPDTYEIMDAKVYIADMRNPNYQTKPEWELCYSARGEYGPFVNLLPTAPLNAQFWHAVTDVFEKNDTAFQRYNEFMTRGGHVKPCDTACKKVAICQIRAARAENNCHLATPGTNFGDTERDQPMAQKPSHSAECEGAGIGHILSRLADGVRTAPLEKLMKEAQLHDIFSNRRQTEDL